MRRRDQSASIVPMGRQQDVALSRVSETFVGAFH